LLLAVVVTTTARILPTSLLPGAPLTDDEVVTRVLGGETSLFEILMRRYNRRLYRVARAILRDDDEAEDVMQHAYVAAYTHLKQFGSRALFSTWLTRIAVHEALARLKRRGREVAGNGDSEAPRPQRGQADGDGRVRPAGSDPEQQLLQQETRSLLESAIGALPVAYRSVFVLREVEGLSTFEVAESLELSADVVKTRLHRARLLLREALFAHAGPPSTAYPFLVPRCNRVVRGVFGQIGDARPD
jgi:RNA polymerase sigma-70 factor (ECF subfamily)